MVCSMAKNEKDRPIVYVYLGALFLVFFLSSNLKIEPFGFERVSNIRSH